MIRSPFSRRGPLNKKILIVEDNSDSREILGLFITRLGHEVIKLATAKKPSHARKPRSRI